MHAEMEDKCEGYNVPGKNNRGFWEVPGHRCTTYNHSWACDLLSGALSVSSCANSSKLKLTRPQRISMRTQVDLMRTRPIQNGH